MISVFDHQKDMNIDEGSLRALVKETLDYLKKPYKEISIYLVSKKEISNLHKKFFNDPTPTDCISFPIDDSHLGELFVCPKVAIEYSKAHTLNPLEETSLYIVHGLLHLIGYDDLTDKQRRVMRKKEKECMSYLNSLNLKLTMK